jgi:hypothetical protein
VLAEGVADEDEAVSPNGGDTALARPTSFDFSLL